VKIGVVGFLKMVAQSVGISASSSPKAKEQVERPTKLIRGKEVVAINEQRREKEVQ
jgi:hypothetical protein